MKMYDAGAISVVEVEDSAVQRVAIGVKLPLLDEITYKRFVASIDEQVKAALEGVELKSPCCFTVKVVYDENDSVDEYDAEQTYFACAGAIVGYLIGEDRAREHRMSAKLDGVKLKFGSMLDMVNKVMKAEQWTLIWRDNFGHRIEMIEEDEE